LQQNHPQQWDLFCLGLLALQGIDESDQLSYYQIAGKGSFPFLPTESEVYTSLQAFMVSLIRLGTVLPVSMVSKADTALTRLFCSCHGTVHTSVSLRYDLPTVHNKQEL
jgi:hypothetical protein